MWRKAKISREILVALLILNTAVASVPIWASIEVQQRIETATVAFNINSQWEGNFLGEIVVTNTGTESIRSWQLEFNMPYEITGLWNGNFSLGDQGRYRITPLDWNQELFPGQILNIGFIATATEEVNLPETYQFTTTALVETINNEANPFVLVEDENYEVMLKTAQDEIWYIFTPATTGSYEITNTGSADICSTLYDATKTKIIMEDGNRLKHSHLGATLIAGNTYYIKTTPYIFDNLNTLSNIVVHPIVEPNDSFFSQQWSLLNKTNAIDINILPVWQYIQDKGIKIGMADTGAYYKHIDLDGTLDVELSYNFSHDMANVFPENEIYGDAYTAVYGHGTHVAGIIGAEENNAEGIVGIAPKSNLIELKTLGRRLEGTTSYTKSIAAFVKAVDYAKQNNIKIVNCSFGGVAPSQAEKEAMLSASDILFVIAAGNSGNDLGQVPEYPACYYHTNSLVVANLDKEGGLNETSSYGGPTDLAAPGTDIISTMPYDQYGYMTGTSMAAPVVAAICGLVWMENEALTPAEVKSTVTNTENVTALESLSRKVLSGGILNAYKSVVNPYLGGEQLTRSLGAKDTTIRDPFVGGLKSKITYYKDTVGDENKTNELIVKFNQNVNIENYIAQLKKQYNFQEMIVSDYLEGISSYVIKCSTIEEADKAINLFNTYNEVKYAEPNYIRD